MNILYYGDNLDILRRYIKDESVDLIYLDPPFKLVYHLHRAFQGTQRRGSGSADLNGSRLKKVKCKMETAYSHFSQNGI